MMNKIILILGAPRCGKTTLAKLLSKSLNYSMISVDDLVSALRKSNVLPLDGDADEITKDIYPFLKEYFNELSNNEINYVIEGTHVDFRIVEALKNNFNIIGLTFNELTEKKIFQNLRKYDNKNDWTYCFDDDTLREKVNCFFYRNKYFNDNFIKYDIQTYDVSHNREKVFLKILSELQNKNY